MTTAKELLEKSKNYGSKTKSSKRGMAELMGFNEKIKNQTEKKSIDLINDQKDGLALDLKGQKALNKSRVELPVAQIEDAKIAPVKTADAESTPAKITDAKIADVKTTVANKASSQSNLKLMKSIIDMCITLSVDEMRILNYLIERIYEKQLDGEYIKKDDFINFANVNVRKYSDSLKSLSEKRLISYEIGQTETESGVHRNINYFRLFI